MSDSRLKWMQDVLTALGQMKLSRDEVGVMTMPLKVREELIARGWELIAPPEWTRPKIYCGAKSPGDPSSDDLAELPVTCTCDPGHQGPHVGGSMIGTIEWERE